METPISKYLKKIFSLHFILLRSRQTDRQSVSIDSVRWVGSEEFFDFFNGNKTKSYWYNILVLLHKYKKFVFLGNFDIFYDFKDNLTKIFSCIEEDIFGSLI